ncbi:MAG: VWA domain-containing protein, partial [Planctomycetes bacterium]|nr:VWA domain-containing protein [Planctomycetota bacterium]
MPATVVRRPLAACLSFLLCLPAALTGQAASSKPALGKGATESLVARYREADHWVQKVVVLLSLNGYWHPAGVEMLIEAMQDRDPRLRAYGLEALLRSDDELLPMVATTELLDELIRKQLGASNKHYAARVEAALKKLAPDAGVDGKREWTRWWRERRDAHQPAAWQEKAQPDPAAGGTSAAANRAFDLYQSGLDLMLCIDSTGSMQPTIDAVALALGEMVDILDGISPKMRLGIVHYKDEGELGKTGAKVVQPFNKNIKAARKKLEKLRAYGGGDLPEAVLGGLDLALHRSMRWQDDANKLVIVIGDAPPHPANRDALIELAKDAHERPGSHGVDNKKPTTGAADKVTPFLTSTMGVFVKLGAGVPVPRGFREFEQAQQQMRKDFQAVAKAGGGVFVEVEFEVKGGPPPTSKEKREARKNGGGGAASDATRRIVEHILVLDDATGG